MIAEPYYYNHLTKPQQAAYREMKSGLLALKASFPVPLLTGRELTDIYFMLRLDCPEIFFSSGFHYRHFADSSNVELIPDYLFEKKKIQEHQKALKARVEKLVRSALKLSELEKELYIHDFICRNIRYDKLKKQYSHEILGSLGQGVSVCEGTAKAVKSLCDALGIWCVIALSEANPDKEIKYRHAWNIVRIDGVFYHLDATFDNTLSREDQVRYDYFNLCDRQIFRDHEPVIWEVPHCGNGDHFYYREKKLSFTKMEEVQKRAAQAVKKGRTLIFHWRGGYLTREVFTELFRLIETEALKKSRHACISVNWAQAVLRVSFTEEMTAEQVVMEEANEGELIL